MATACCGAQRVAAGPEPARKPAAAPRAAGRRRQAAPRPPRARGPAAGFWRGPAWASPAPLGLALALLVACRGALRLGGLPAGGAAGGGGGVSRGRLLSSAVGAQEAGATLDEVGTWVFSRPPHSRLERSEAVFWLLAGIYAYCGLVVAVGLYLDVRDWRWRADRSTSPQVLVPVQFCCSRILIRQSSLPSQIADQYYLDARALKPSSDADVVLHTRPTNFWGYAFRYAKGFGDALSREHLAFSLLVWVAPTFPRPKRSLLVVLHLHACMLTAALVLNRREHEEPQGTYEVFKCASGGSGCMATCPLAVAAGAALLPVFQILQRQFRLTSFVSQEHVCNSLFPLGTRKFATMPRRSAWDSICCRRNSLERQTHKIEQRRHVLHRAVKALWMATRPSVADLSFYTGQTSWCMLFAAMSFLAAVVLYLVFFTLYLGQAAADHFGVWTLTMHFSSLLLVEPLWIFLTRVFWNALVTDVGQYWGLGAQSVTATTTYSHLVRNIEESFFGKVKDVGSRRIQRWWLDVLHMRRSIQRETLAAIKLQTIWRSTSQRVKFIKDRKWCLKVEVLDADQLHVVSSTGEQSPQVLLKCDAGNPRLLQTDVSWNTGASGSFHETFLLDVKRSSSLYVSVWAKDVKETEFIGRGLVVFDRVKSSRNEHEEPRTLRVPLHAMEHGEQPRPEEPPLGFVNLRVQFLNPLQDPCGEAGRDAWMLPASRAALGRAADLGGPGAPARVLVAAPEPAAAAPEGPASGGAPREPLGQWLPGAGQSLSDEEGQEQRGPEPASPRARSPAPRPEALPGEPALVEEVVQEDFYTELHAGPFEAPLPELPRRRSSGPPSKPPPAFAPEEEGLGDAADGSPAGAAAAASPRSLPPAPRSPPAARGVRGSLPPAAAPPAAPPAPRELPEGSGHDPEPLRIDELGLQRIDSLNFAAEAGAAGPVIPGAVQSPRQ